MTWTAQRPWESGAGEYVAYREVGDRREYLREIPTTHVSSSYDITDACRFKVAREAREAARFAWPTKVKRVRIGVELVHK